MTARDNHVTEELGAYLLGALDDAEAGTVDEHLASCRACQAELDELTPLHNALGEIPPEMLLEGPPDGGDLLLRRTLRQARAEERSGTLTRRVLIGAAAVVAVALALGGGVLLGRGAAPVTVAAAPAPTTTPTAVAGTRELTATQDGTRLTATITPAAGWVRVNASVTGIPAGQRCQLVVISRSGDQELAGGWVVSPAAATTGVNLDGSALIAADQVASVEVRNTEGHIFVVANA